MEARDKYTVFSKWDRGYRKGIHKMPKFTRVRILAYFQCVRRLSYNVHHRSPNARTRRVSRSSLLLCTLLFTTRYTLLILHLCQRGRVSRRPD